MSKGVQIEVYLLLIITVSSIGRHVAWHWHGMAWQVVAWHHILTTFSSSQQELSQPNSLLWFDLVLV